MSLLVAEPGEIPATASLPDPVAAWLDATWHEGVDEIDTLVLTGRAGIRRGTAGPRIPARFTLSHVLGRQMVLETRLALGPLGLGRSLDACVDGHGISAVGRELADGPWTDQAAFVLLWAAAFPYPQAWRHLRGLLWEALGPNLAVLDLPFDGGLERAVVRFDPETHFPVSFEAQRHRGGRRVPWWVAYEGWRWLGGVPVPRRGSMRWEQDPEPSFTFRVDDAVPDAPVGDALRRARDLLAAAKGTAPG